MSEMVERVALALWKDRYPDDEWNETDRRDFEGHARAAIEAMREPTQQMLDAMNGPDEHERINFVAAIDAALRQA
jgi:hypothetical protein